MRSRFVGLFGAASLAIAGLLAGSTAAHAATFFLDDDDCGRGSNPFYFAEGPAAFWHAATYSGGPNGIGGICEMWTNNVSYYVSITYDNTSYWYLPVSGGWSGNYVVWAFEPAPNATSRPPGC